MIKTETGRIANFLVRKHPNTIFVVEDLDLSGCRGQKRFAYRALAKALYAKAPVESVNPAYTSQECPSCGYVCRLNRIGTKFQCRSCGRKAHADWVGASGILRRSGDNDITCRDHPNSVKSTLRRRFTERRQARCTSPARSSTVEPSPLGLSLTTEALVQSGIGTGSNLVPASTA
jgi:transposase